MLRPLMKTAGIGIALYLLLKAWVHYQAHQWLESLKAELEFHAAINYDWLATNPLMGQIELVGLRVTPFQLRQALSAESLLLDFGGLTDLLALAAPQSDGFAPPKALALRLTGLQVPVAERWSAFGANPYPALLPLLQPPCGRGAPLSVAFFHDLGLQWLTFDGDLEYVYDPRSGRMDYRHDLIVEEMGSFALQVSLDRLVSNDDSSAGAGAGAGAGTGIGTGTGARTGADAGARTVAGTGSGAGHEPAATASVLTGSARLRLLDLQVEDRTFLRVLNRTCALAQGVATGDYAALAWRDLEQDLDALGIRVGKGMAAALADFLKGEGSMHLKVTTPEDFDPARWFGLSPGKVADRLPLSLAVNDRVVIDPYYEIDFARLLPQLVPPAPPAPAKVKEPAPVDQRGVARQRSYVAVDPAALALYSGFPVRLTHKDGKTTTGVLGEVLPKSIDVRVPMASGDVVFHVAPSDVQGAEVFQ